MCAMVSRWSVASSPGAKRSKRRSDNSADQQYPEREPFTHATGPHDGRILQRSERHDDSRRMPEDAAPERTALCCGTTTQSMSDPEKPRREDEQPEKKCNS